MLSLELIMSAKKPSMYSLATGAYVRLKQRRKDKLFQLAEKAYIDGNWQLGVKLWSKIIKNFDEAPFSAWAKLGRSYRMQGAFANAEKVILEALKKYPNTSGLKNELAEIATDSEDWKSAYDRWNEILHESDQTNTRYTLIRYYVSLLKRLARISKYKSEISKYRGGIDIRRPRIVIFTAIVGGYDALMPPEKLDDRFDYVVFTDQPVKNYGIYKVKPIPFFSEDPTRSARFVKTHPHILLNEYDIAIWIDANIMISGDIYPIIKSFKDSRKPVGAIPHPIRKSVYEEAEACIKGQKGDEDLVLDQIQHYRSIGFRKRGLIESNFMIFNLRDKLSTKFLDLWWSEIDQFSKRDQISINFSLHKTKTDWYSLTRYPNSTRNHSAFILTSHETNRSLVLKLADSLSRHKVDPYEGIAENKNKKTKYDVDVVVCVHNAAVEVNKCLNSIEKTRAKNLKLIIVDDGSDMVTADMLNGFIKNKTWVKLVRNETATGYTRAANRGIRESKGDLVILLNSDTIVTDKWVNKIANAAFSMPGIGIVGPLSSAASHQSIPENLSSATQTAVNELPEGITVERMNKYCEKWSISNYYPFVPLVHGFCFGITRELINKIGFFDETNFPRGYGEENDYCFRAIDAGFCLALATNTYIFHAKSKSYKSEQRIQLMKEGSHKLQELYGEKRIRRAILSMRQNPELIRVRNKAKTLYK